MALPPLSPSGVFTQWTFDATAAAITIAVGLLYVGGVRRLRSRHHRWSAARSTSFATGLAMLLLATQSGIAAYDTVSFTAHVVQHVLLGIVAPFFLALGAPITLALQAAHRPTQVNLLRVLRSRPVAVISHPLVAGGLFAFSLFVLYFSPLYELSLRNGVVHGWVHIHFLVVGSLFFWVAIGLDPAAHRVPYGARLLLVLLTVPFHAFLGLALMSTQHPLAESYYAAQDRTGQVEVLDDQHSGAALMWAVGELVALAAGGVILVQWSAHEQRQTRRLDRRLDALELASAGSTPGRP